MTFLGFYVDRASGNIIEPATGQVLLERAMSHELQNALVANRVPINENFERLERFVHSLCDDFVSSSICIYVIFGVIIIDSFVVFVQTSEVG
jgi:hypothetical protein